MSEMSKTELEQLARARAERLLSPTDRAIQNAPERPPVRPVEPSLEERLEAIDRRAREHAENEKRELALVYLARARERFAEAVDQTVDLDVKRTFGEVRAAERLVSQTVG